MNLRSSPIDIPRMADAAQKILKDSLDAFVARDAELAMDVCDADDFFVDKKTPDATVIFWSEKHPFRTLLSSGKIENLFDNPAVFHYI